ncbi:hypothetical protein PG987_009755 [Apiospora arundinis]
MTSTNRSARIPDEKWDAHKTNIVRQFVDHDQSLEVIVDSLKSSGFIVTRNQLHHRLNKTWRIHKKTSKGEAAPTWRYIDHQIAERIRNGKTISDVYINDVLVEPAKVKKETGRHSERAWSIGIVHPLILGSPVDKELVSKWRDRTLHHSISRLVSSGHDSNLRIPEAKENEAAQRLRIIRFGSAEDALREQLKLLFLQASNKSLFRGPTTLEVRFQSMLQIIKLIDFVGFMRKRLETGEDLTLLAAREGLFQLVFHLMARVFNSMDPDTAPLRRLLDGNTDVITRFVEWLLRSGQDPNLPMECSSGILTSALQCALQCKLDALVGILIQHKADVRGRLPYFHCGYMFNCQAHLPPLVIAMMSGGTPNSETLLGDIEKHRTLLKEFLSLTQPREVLRRGQDPNKPDIDHPLYHFLKGPDNEVGILSVLKTIKRIVGPTWLETSIHGEGLLFHASRAGYLDVLSFLLDNNVDINTTNTAGSTALHNAVIGFRSPYATCKYLLDHGAILDSSDANMSAFHLACSTVDDVEILRLLCSRGACVHRTIAGMPNAREWLEHCNRFSTETLLIKLEKNSTPLKAAINNTALDRQESVKFCMQMGQSSAEVVEWICDAALHSSDIHLLSAALRTGSWHALRLDRRDGLLRNTMQCCSNYSYGHTGSCSERGVIGTRIAIANELLEAGVRIGSSDAIHALFLGDWDLAQNIRMRDPLGIAGSPLPLEDGSISFLEAALLWCPRYAFEAMMTNPYDPGSLCAAALGVCKNELSLDIVEGLLTNRLTCNSSTLDASVEMAAIGIALYNNRTQMLELLQRNLPTYTFARLPHPTMSDWEFTIGSSGLWWHQSRMHGSVACFLSNADIESFTAIVKQYCWDVACLSFVIENRDHAKAEVLMNHNTLRQDPLPTWPINSKATYPPLVRAIEAGDSKLVQVCVELGESIHGGWNFESDQWKGHTALAEAVSYNNLEIVDLVLKLGADVNQKGYDCCCHFDCVDETLYTPLQRACIEGNLAIVKRLIDEGADLNAVDDEGLTALEYAARDGRLDMVQLLLSRGVDIEGEYGSLLDSAIFEASFNRHMVTVKLLKAHAEKVGYVLVDDKDNKGDDDDGGDGGDKDDEGDEEEDQGGEFYQAYQALCETSTRSGGFI